MTKGYASPFQQQDSVAFPPKPKSIYRKGGFYAPFKEAKILKTDFTTEEWSQVKVYHKHFKDTINLLFPDAYQTHTADKNLFKLNYHVHTFCLESHKTEGVSPNLKQNIRNKYGVSGSKSLAYASKHGLKVCFYPQWIIPQSIKYAVFRTLTKTPQTSEGIEYQNRLRSIFLSSQRPEAKNILPFSADQDCYAYQSMIIDLDYEQDYETLIGKLENLKIKHLIRFIIQTSPKKFHLYIKAPLTYHVNYFLQSPFAKHIYEHQSIKRDIQSNLLEFEQEEKKFLLFWKALATILGGDLAVTKIAQPFQAPGYLNPKGNIQTNPQFRATCVFKQPYAELTHLNHLLPYFQAHLPLLQEKLPNCEELEPFGIKFPQKVYSPEKQKQAQKDLEQYTAFSKVNRYKKLKQHLAINEPTLASTKVYPIPLSFEEFKSRSPKVSTLIPDSLNITGQRNSILNAFASYLPFFLTPEELASPTKSLSFQNYLNWVIIPYFEKRTFELKSKPKWKGYLTSHLQRWSLWQARNPRGNTASSRTPLYWKNLFAPEITPEAKVLHQALTKSLVLAQVPSRQIKTLSKGILWPLAKLLAQESFESIVHQVTPVQKILFPNYRSLPASALQYREYGGLKPLFIPYKIQRLYGNYDPTYQMALLEQIGFLKRTPHISPKLRGQSRLPNILAKKCLSPQILKEANHSLKAEFTEYFEFQEPKAAEFLIRVPELAFAQEDPVKAPPVEIKKKDGRGWLKPSTIQLRSNLQKKKMQQERSLESTYNPYSLIGFQKVTKSPVSPPKVENVVPQEHLPPPVAANFAAHIKETNSKRTNRKNSRIQRLLSQRGWFLEMERDFILGQKTVQTPESSSPSASIAQETPENASHQSLFFGPVSLPYKLNPAALHNQYPPFPKPPPLDFLSSLH
jgi:hypothetical protein